MNMDWIGFRIYDEWIRNVRDGHYIKDFFIRNNYNKIAIYGMGVLGRQIKDELAGTEINVCYVIDRKADQIAGEEVRIIRPDEIRAGYLDVDAVVVTPIPDFYSIEKELNEIYGDADVDIISARDMVWYSK